MSVENSGPDVGKIIEENFKELGVIEFANRTRNERLKGKLFKIIEEERRIAAEFDVEIHPSEDPQNTNS